jgi:hypothetical protein
MNYFDYLFLNLVTCSLSFTDKTEKRYNPNMSPAIRKNKWRKGSQVIIVVLDVPIPFEGCILSHLSSHFSGLH